MPIGSRFTSARKEPFDHEKIYLEGPGGALDRDAKFVGYGKDVNGELIVDKNKPLSADGLTREIWMDGMVPA